MSLAPEQQRLLQVVYNAFRQSSQWPTYDYVERTGRRAGLKLAQLLPALPKGLLHYDASFQPPRRDGQLALTIAGVATCASADGDVAAFFCALQLGVALERDAVPPSPLEAVEVTLSSQEFLEAWAAQGGFPTRDLAARVGLLLDTSVPAAWGGMRSTPDGEWTLIVSPGIHAYAGVQTVDQLGEAVQALRARLVPTPVVLGRRPAHRVGWRAPAEPAAVTPAAAKTGPRIFVLMPFNEHWSDATHAVITKTVEALRKESSQLECQRADQIAKPGRITDQITEAIRVATVIVADITDDNPNVMFEVGFARALRKPLVLLNQDVGASPFDLYDFRQIAYSPATPDATQETLTTWLHGLLVGSGPPAE